MKICSEKENEKKSKLILILEFVLLLLLPAGLSRAETLIASKGFYAGDPFVYNNLSFQINFAAGFDKIVVVGDSSILNVANNSCGITNAIKFCLRDVVFDAARREYKASIDIYAVNAELKIIRSISKSNLLINEETSVGVTIVNEGGCSATDISFFDEIPPEFEITYLNGTQNRSNIIFWNGFLNNASNISFSYTIRAKDIVEKSFSANLSYFDCAKKRDIFSTPFKIKISPALEQKIILGKATAEVGETNNITINLTNRDSQRIVIDSISVIPDNYISVVSTNLLKDNEKFYRNDFELIPNATASFQILFKNMFVGSADIAIFVLYRDFYNKSRTLYNRQGIKAMHKPINIKTNFNRGELIESDYTRNIQVSVENPSNFAALKNIRIDIETNITPMNDNFIETLGASSQKVASETRYKAPLVNTTQFFPFNIKAYYETEFGERFEKSVETSLGIKPPEKLEITHLLVSSIEENSETNIQVSIKNNRNVDLPSVTLYETIPKSFGYSGKLEHELYIRAGATKTYLYKVKVPDIINRSVFEINTTATYSYGNYSYSLTKSSSITVFPKVLSVSFDKTISESEIYEGKILTVDYKITNNDNEPIRNIRIYPSIQKEIDQINPKDYIPAGNLFSGEYQVIGAQESIRFKSNGSIALKESRMLFDDYYGNSYEKNSSKITLRISENPIAGPAIMIDKYVNITQHNLTADNSSEHSSGLDSDFIANISLNVKNIGNMGTMIELEDSGKRWSFDLAPGMEKKISHQKRLHTLTEEEKKGLKVYFPEAVAYYNYSENTLKTLSNDFYATLPLVKGEEKKVDEHIEKLVGEKIPEVTPEVVAGEEGKKIDEEKKDEGVGIIEGRKEEGLLNRIINFIIKIFMVKRSN